VIAIFVVAFVVLPFCVGYVFLVSRLARSNTTSLLWLKAGGILAAPRLAVFWLLVVLWWTERLTLVHMPLLLFLIPEAFFLPRNVAWTLPKALPASAILLAGSFLWAGLAVLAVTRRQRVLS